MQPTKPDGSAYDCTFSDDFDGNQLDTSKWLPVRSLNTGFITGLGYGSPDCYFDRPENISVRDGSLHLTSRVEGQMFDCRANYGTFPTNESAGSVVTYGKFAQAFGRFEVRAKFPANATTDYISALWLSPEVPVYGAWPNSGEVDIAEWFGDGWGTNPVFPSVHYAGEDPAKSTGRTCAVPGAGTSFHTYAVEWTENTMSFYYDDELCFEHAWTPKSGFTGSQPFDQPFNIVLTQTGGFMRPVGTVVDLEVDWVRAWK